MIPHINPRVLCVEDDPDTREMLTLLLKSLGIPAKVVSNGAECLSSSYLEQFEFYLLDAWLPDCDGVDLCRALRELNPTACLIFYSGAAFETDRQRAMDAGADAYIVKPEVDQLITMLSQLAAPSEREVVCKSWPRRRRNEFVSLPSFMTIS